MLKLNAGSIFRKDKHSRPLALHHSYYAISTLSSKIELPTGQQLPRAELAVRP